MSAKDAVGSRPGSETAHAIVDFHCGAVPVDAAVVSFEHGGESGLGMVLRAGSDFSRGEAAQSVCHQGRASFGETSGKFRRGFYWADFELTLQKDVAGVHTGVNAHGGEAGSRFSIDDGPVDGCGAAVFWEKGSVKIDPAVFWEGEQARRNDLAVGDDHDEVWGIALQEFLDFRGADLFGLMDGEFGGKSDFFYGGERNLAAAAARAVRLGDDGEDFEVGLREEVLEGENGELRRATEKNAHLYASAAANGPAAALTTRPVSGAF